MRVRDVTVKLQHWPHERHHLARVDLTVEQGEADRLLAGLAGSPENPGHEGVDLAGAMRSMVEVMMAAQRQQAPSGMRFRNDCLEVELAEGGVVGYPLSAILYWQAGPEREVRQQAIDDLARRPT